MFLRCAHMHLHAHTWRLARISNAPCFPQAWLPQALSSTCIVDVCGNLLIHGHLHLGVVLNCPPHYTRQHLHIR